LQDVEEKVTKTFPTPIDKVSARLSMRMLFVYNENIFKHSSGHWLMLERR
jgi:hypothetical protein